VFVRRKIHQINLICSVLPSGFFDRVLVISSILIVQVAWSWNLLSGQDEVQFRQAKERFERTYGSDHNLLNGRQYYLLYSNTSHPFLEDESARPGRLILNGVVYEGVPINYDLYQQAVVLQYISHAGETRYLELNRECLEEFRMGGKVFRKVAVQGDEEQYAQVIQAGTLRFIILWKKNMNYKASMNQTPYRYTNVSKRLFFEGNGMIQRVASRSSFLKLFDDAQRSSVRLYLKQEGIRFRKAYDLELQKLLDYCNQLDSSGL
jgi:hypothetical protein